MFVRQAHHLLCLCGPCQLALAITVGSGRVGSVVGSTGPRTQVYTYPRTCSQPARRKRVRGAPPGGCGSQEPEETSGVSGAQVALRAR